MLTSTQNLATTILGNHTLPLYFLPHYYYHTSKPYSAFILSTLLSSYFTTLLLLRQDFGGRFSCCPAVRRLVMSPEAPVCALTKVIIIICISHILFTIFLCCCKIVFLRSCHGQVVSLSVLSFDKSHIRNSVWFAFFGFSDSINEGV